jgi:hypothetical protein
MGGDVTLVQPRADSSSCRARPGSLGRALDDRPPVGAIFNSPRPVQSQARQRRREGWIGSSGVLAVYSGVSVRDLALVFRVEPEG